MHPRYSLQLSRRLSFQCLRLASHVGLAPGEPCRAIGPSDTVYPFAVAMLSGGPFSFIVSLDPDAVDRQMQRAFRAATRDGDRKGPLPSADGAKSGTAQFSPVIRKRSSTNPVAATRALTRPAVSMEYDRLSPPFLWIGGDSCSVLPTGWMLERFGFYQRVNLVDAGGVEVTFGDAEFLPHQVFDSSDQRQCIQTVIAHQVGP